MYFVGARVIEIKAYIRLIGSGGCGMAMALIRSNGSLSKHHKVMSIVSCP